ncbi:E3 ubiquitin-protein ligase ubr1, partial [Kickxella alabastrina]
VAKSCRQFAECYGATARDLFFTMRGTLRRLHRAVILMPEENYAFIVRAAQAQGLPLPPLPSSASDDVQLRPQMHTLPTLWGRQYDIVRYDMATSPVSFHHPLHWFMAELCQHVALMTDTNAHALGFASVRDLVFSALDARLDARLDAPLHSEVPYALSPHEVPFAQREMLRILDYPVRVCVVMAQIRAGLWVRNGYVIRSQSHHYREVSLRENTYDQDIVMIQFFMSLWPDPDHILMTMLDRFGLFDWLSGRPHPLPGYEPTHMHYMVEEFLNLLIVLVSERHVATGKTAVDLARREIVHGCLSPISYSELTKKVPERLTELTEFDNLLQEMADYRGPLSVLDHGLYELKDELLDEVDPYFIHYSRNQREEVEELLRERLKKRLRKSGGDPDAVPAYFPPKLEPIRAGPFQRVGLVLHTPLACQILFYALLHATHTQSELLSETMVDEALQLIVIALEDGRRDAVAREIGGPDASSPATATGAQLPNADRGGLWKYALEQGYPSGRGAPLNLLGLVLTLGLKPEMKQWKPKLNYIYQLFREGGPRIVSCIDDYYANLEATPMGSRVLKSAMEETKAAERKKKAAQARQAAILAEFANRQNDFMNQYGDEYDALSDDENYAEEGYEVLGAPEKGKSTDTSRVHKALWGPPSGACMVCQEECDSSKPYGMLSLVQTNRAIRNAPLADATHIVDILRLPGGLDTTITHTSSLAPQSPEDTALPSPVKNTAAAAATIAAARLQSADNLGVISQMASGAYGAPSGLKSFPVLYHERGLAASTCGHVMHTRCFTQYCQGIEAKRQQQPTRNHPESLHRKEFLCPLCKSLGNVLLPSLPQSADFDPLVIADRNPDLFSQPASAVADKLTTEFERWIQEDWKPFGETMDAIASDQIIRGPEPAHASNLASSSGGNVNLAGAGASASSARHGAAGSSAVSSSSVLPMAEQPAASGTSAGIQSALSIDSAIGGLTSALRSPGSFSFNIADSLAESIPRLDALLRSAQRFPAGLTFQALLSRFLPQLGSGPLGMPPGVERMVLPLSQYVHWLVERQAAEHTHHQNYVQNRKNMHDQAQLRLARGIAGDDNDNDNAGQYATPETSGNLSSSMPHLPAGNAALPERVAGDQEAKAREQMETYQFMYTRLYDVLQNVQRDNYVGLPSTSLFEHLYRSKDKGAAGASSHQHQHTSHASATAEQYASRNYGEEDEDYEEDDDEEEDHYMYRGASGSGPPGSVGHNPEQPATSMPQFFQNIMEHLRVLSASSGSQAGMQSLTSSENASLSAQLHSANKMRPYPFDKATSSLFAHTIELFELSQRGIRNPPVFDHEDLRTLPSGTLLDAIPEAHAVFMHSLGKISEIQYRTMFSPTANILRTSVDGSDSQAESTSPAQRLRTLVLESQAGGVLPSAGLHGGFVARTRLEMLKELGYALSPLNGSHITRPRDLQNEQSRWATGDDGMPAKPFLMQDNFALLTDISLSLVIPFGLDIWQLVRLFVTAELVRACVAVGDSILGEYTGAPKGLRIAKNQPVDMGSNPPNMPPTVHSAAATATATAAANVAEAAAGQAPTATSRVPHSWVDAPEARDVKLLSLLSSGSDASLLQESSAGIYTLVSWAIRQLQGP